MNLKAESMQECVQVRMKHIGKLQDGPADWLPTSNVQKASIVNGWTCGSTYDSQVDRSKKDKPTDTELISFSKHATFLEG